MDAAMPITITQAVLLWTLLGFLLIWMILFAVLAFRGEPIHHNKSESAFAPSRSIGAENSHTAPAMLRVLAAQSAPARVGAASHDAPSNDK